MTNPAILITGAAKRVGKAMALHFAKQGWDIALHYHHSEDEARATAEEIQELGVQCQRFQQDLTVIPALAAFMGEVNRTVPNLQALINSASVFEPCKFAEMDEAHYDRDMDINLKSPLFLTHAFVEHVKQGAVINIIDSFTTKEQTTFFPYLLAKKSLKDATRMLAATLAPDIRVNAVCPGTVLPAPGFGEDFMRKKEASLPMQALATPEDVAATCHQLISNKALTGQIIYVDGGEQLI